MRLPCAVMRCDEAVVQWLPLLQCDGSYHADTMASPQEPPKEHRSSSDEEEEEEKKKEDKKPGMADKACGAAKKEVDREVAREKRMAQNEARQTLRRSRNNWCRKLRSGDCFGGD